MKTRTKFLVTTLSLTMVLMALHPIGPLGDVLWPQPEPDAEQPAAWQLPLFLALFLAEAGVTAFGVAYLLFGWTSTRRLIPGRPRFALAVHVSLSYLLIQWWPHGNLHLSVPFSFGSILAIDLGFHIPIMAASLVVLAGLVEMARRTGPALAVTGARDHSPSGAPSGASDAAPTEP